MKLYTVCYLIKDNSFLMLYRNKKENDINKGKWIGVGGKIEKNETIHQSIIREIREETGFIANKVNLRGIINFGYNSNLECIFVFTCNDFTGNMIECDEGKLEYVNKNEILNLNLWEGDKIFLKRLIDNDTKFWTYTMIYENDKLVKVVEDE